MSTFEIITTSIRVRLAMLNKTQTWLASELGRTKAWLSDRMNGRVGMDTEDIDAIASGLGITPASLYSGELIPEIRAAA